MKKSLLAAAAATALLSGQTASAENWYAGALAGYVWNNDQTYKSSEPDVKISLDDGYDFSLFAGYNFGPLGTAGSARAELEYSWRDSGTNKGKEGDFSVNVKGAYTESAFFVNAFYDFDQSGSVWVPYVGGGVGYGKLSYDNYKAQGTKILDESDDVWGYQLIAGVGYNLNAQTRVFADYRYRDWDDSKVKATDGTKLSVSNASSSLNFGVLYQF